jgi:DNA-binding response OmpR family regulator
MQYLGPNITKIKVMILEDEFGLAHTLSAVLEKNLGVGSSVKVCGTAEVALQMLQIHKFDLIISDWRLPGMSGMDFISQVRQSFPEMPIIFMTAFGTDQIEEQAQAVSDYYLKKPFEISELTHVIDQLLHLGMADSFPVLPSQQTEKEPIPRRILVLEDDESLLNLYRKGFQKSSHIVHTAQTFASANGLLGHKNFDLLICDVKIDPNIGVDLLWIWREKLIKNNTRVVIISGDPCYHSMSEKIGADFFFRKPVEPAALVNLANNLSSSPGKDQSQLDSGSLTQ